MSIVVRALCATLLLMLAASAAARMYQWVDPRSGTVQLSGAPPAWYRSAQTGPRVFVFENGRLVDDTARPVDPDQAAALRAGAFGASEPAMATLSPHSPLRAPMFEAPPESAAPIPEEDGTSARIAEFKALLEAYDQTQAAAARDALDDADAALAPGVPSAPSP